MIIYTKIMKHIYNDGGRAVAGYKGTANDCVVRAIAIATGKPYTEIHKLIGDANGWEPSDGLKAFRSPENGNCKSEYEPVLAALGFKWVATMGIGTGCKVHLRDGELPMGKIVVRLSCHLSAVLDGVLNDTFDCSRNGSRCVYGYWTL